jgi:hypothetical protein
LKDALNSTALFDADPTVVRAFLSEDRIVHVYGSLETETVVPVPEIRASNNKDSDIEPETSEAKEAFVKWDRIYWRSKQIRVIDPHDKPRNERALQIARKRIKEASSVYILGYGFDENNNRRIGLEALRQEGDSIPYRRVHFTNFDDSARINKRAGLLLAEDASIFLQQGHLIKEVSDSRYTEKSVRNVYNALAVDFDL